ncbi:hypothetical protein LTR53_003509 [Teratosphaeriaceae sp. CCFEE 6253]|nr:hypothetical protein LTR53_003509 [Teratosphaeriaceae sp. CCFEE 6253]
MGFLESFRSSGLNRIFQRLLRVFQFLSSVISLGLFSSRVAKIARLSQRISRSNGAVEGILSAAVAYTLLVMLLTFILKNGGPRILRWLLMLLDLLYGEPDTLRQNFTDSTILSRFVGGFIAVAVLTRPNGGSSGPCRNTGRLQNAVIPNGQNCNLPWGTFILAIISTILHFLTALFHEIKDRRHERQEKEARDGFASGYA